MLRLLRNMPWHYSSMDVDVKRHDDYDEEQELQDYIAGQDSQNDGWIGGLW